jgi:hypothetical protein
VPFLRERAGSQEGLMSITSFRPVLLAAAIVVSFLVSGCSSQDKAGGPPKPGTVAHTFYSAGVAWKAGEFEKALVYLSKVAASDNEYRDRARAWLVVASAGVADGYLALSNAYDEGSKLTKGAAAADFRNQMREVRNIANTAALQFAESVHEFMDKNKDPQFRFDFDFPTGSVDEPLQIEKVRKGLPMQKADHEVVRKAMATRGVVKFAALVAGSPGDLQKASAQFPNTDRDTVLKGVASSLISAADLYCQKKLDLPKRGNALCNEALEAIALLPEGKEKKALEAKARAELKRHKVSS